MIQERESRFVVAYATGKREQELATRAIQQAYERTYRQPVHTGQRGRLPLRVPQGVALTQTIKHRNQRGRLVWVETRATIGEPVEQPQPVHVEGLNGVLRDRLACLTRKTHAFAKSPATWDAMVGLALFEHNWLRPHPALRLPSTVPCRRYDSRTPAMARGLTDHCSSWQEFLTMRRPITN